MSAALPEHDRPDRQDPHGNVRRLASVAPAADAGESRRDDERDALRDQLVHLARHYAADVSRLHRALDRARTDEARARTERLRAERTAEAIRTERDRLREEAALLRDALEQERARREILREAAEMPWWAVRRRRELLRATGHRP
ncbi:MAG: hypothetical protein ACQEXJ_09220 [Myxococcota bacterium]